MKEKKKRKKEEINMHWYETIQKEQSKLQEETFKFYWKEPEGDMRQLRIDK